MKGLCEGNCSIWQFFVLKFKSGRTNRYEVTPSYTFWAPWIGRNVRNSEVVFNTEHRKCHREEDENELGNLEISEDRLIKLLHGNKV